jgi:hypothetical protein
LPDPAGKSLSPARPQNRGRGAPAAPGIALQAYTSGILPAMPATFENPPQDVQDPAENELEGVVR